MKRIIIFVLFIFLSICLISCNNKPDNSIDDSDVNDKTDDKDKKDDDSKDEEEYIHTINYATQIDEYYLYSNMHLFDSENEIPLYNCKVNFSHTWNGEAPMRMNSGVGIIELNGKAKFHLKTDFKINDICTIRPLSQNVWFKTNEDSIDFVIEKSGDYTIEFSNQRTLHLFVYDILEEELDSNTIVFGPGIHNKDNSSYINSNGVLNVGSNQHIHLSLGAILEARLVSSSTNNVKITGRGIIAGAKFDRSVERGTTFVPFDFNFVSNLLFKDIVCLDPAGWCYNIYFCNHVELDGVKIISSRSNGDGISIQSCQNVYVHNAFVRSWDDSLVVKNYPKWSDRSVEGTTINIVFEKCILWTDLAQSMEIGYETVGNVMEDIHFNDIIVLHNFHKAVISIHNGNNANIKNVSYKNIIVEDAKMGKGDGKNVIIEFQNLYSSNWSSQHKKTSLGYISDIEIDGVYVYNATSPEIVLTGTKDSRPEYDNDEIHDIKNVLIKDLYINDIKVDINYDKLEQLYVSELEFK